MHKNTDFQLNIYAKEVSVYTGEILCAANWSFSRFDKTTTDAHSYAMISDKKMIRDLNF